MFFLASRIKLFHLLEFGCISQTDTKRVGGIYSPQFTRRQIDKTIGERL